MDVQIANLNDFEDALQRGLDRIGELRAGTRVSSDAFFAQPFMREHTQYNTFEAFQANAPLELDVPLDDHSETSRDRLNKYVSEVTEFETWEKMQTKAAQEEIINQLISNTT